jgi:hypothetical protein
MQTRPEEVESPPFYDDDDDDDDILCTFSMILTRLQNLATN